MLLRYAVFIIEMYEVTFIFKFIFYFWLLLFLILCCIEFLSPFLPVCTTPLLCLVFQKSYSPLGLLSAIFSTLGLTACHKILFTSVVFHNVSMFSRSARFHISLTSSMKVYYCWFNYKALIVFVLQITSRQCHTSYLGIVFTRIFTSELNQNTFKRWEDTLCNKNEINYCWYLRPP